MPDTQTPNYQLWKPEIDAAADYWGQLLNANFDAIDTLLFQRVSKTPNGGQQILPNHLMLTGQPGQSTIGDTSAATVGWVEYRLAQIAAASTANSDRRTVAYFNWIYPIRTIIMTQNTYIGAQPPGWSPCNGGTYNGITTPDLHDRFIIAAGAGLRGDAGGYEANPSWYFEHQHHSQLIYSGPAGNPKMQAMWDNRPKPEDGGTNGVPPQPGIAVPYYVLTFLMKTRDWVVGDIPPNA